MTHLEQAARIARQHLPQAREAIVQRFGGQKIRASVVPEALTAITRWAVDEPGLHLVALLASDQALVAHMARGARQRFRDDAEQWLAQVGHVRDFSHPLAWLFHLLDDARLRDGKNWHVTIAESSMSASFASDNWPFFLAYALSQGARQPAEQYGVVVRRFERLADTETGIPLKSVTALQVVDRTAVALDANTVRSAMESGRNAGALAEKGVRYVDARKLIPEWFAG